MTITGLDFPVFPLSLSKGTRGSEAESLGPSLPFEIGNGFLMLRVEAGEAVTPNADRHQGSWGEIAHASLTQLS